MIVLSFRIIGPEVTKPRSDPNRGTGPENKTSENNNNICIHVYIYIYIVPYIKHVYTYIYIYTYINYNIQVNKILWPLRYWTCAAWMAFAFGFKYVATLAWPSKRRNGETGINTSFKRTICTNENSINKNE